MPLDHPDPDDPGAPVHEPIAGPAPSPDDVRRMLAGVIDPELHTSIVDLGMVDDVHVDRRRSRDGHGRAHHGRMPTPRPDQDGRRVEGAGLARRRGRRASTTAR